MQNITINLSDLLSQINKEQTLIDVNLQQGFTMYLNFIKLNTSIANYQNNLNHSKTMLKYFNERYINTFLQVNNNSINYYIEFMKSKNNKNRTINIRISLILRVYKYLVANKLLSNYEFDFKKLKEQPTNIEVINYNNLEQILDYSKTLEPKYHLMILIMIGCGTRRGETSDIRIKDINYQEQSIALVKTKSNKIKFIFPTEEVFLLCKEVALGNKSFLFENKDNSKFTADAISSMIKRIKSKLMIDHLTPHKLRHSYATILIKQGANIETVRRLMGHSKIEMTKRYFDFNDEELKQESLKFNPLTFLDKKKSL